MGKSAPKPPPAPDPNAVSAAQTASNIQTASAQASLNNVNQVTPWGSLTYTQPFPGSMQWQATQTLSPAEQQLMQMSEAGQSLYGNTALAQLGAAQQSLSTPLQTPVSPFAAYQQAQGALSTPITPPTSPFAASNAAQAYTQANPFQSNAQQAGQQYINSQMQLMQPQWDLQRQNMQSQLAAQGVPQGSDAWNNAMRQTEGNISNAQAQILSGATQNEAVAAQTGINLYNEPLNVQQAQAGLLGQGLNQSVGLQQQAAAAAQAQQGLLGGGLQQAATLQQLPLNEASALLSGSQVQQPNFVNPAQTQISPTNVLGAYGLQQQALQNNYNQQMANYSSSLGGIGSLLGTLGGASMMGGTGGFATSALGSLFSGSDERLKTDIQPVGSLDTPAGTVPLKTFRFKGSPVRMMGLIAQDVEKTHPHAVMTDPLTGMKGVNYAHVLASMGTRNGGQA